MRDGSLRHRVDREIDWRKRVCGTVRGKKKKNEKGNPPLAREFFSFARLDWSVVSLSFLVSFYFILSYCYFFFLFLPNIHGRQGTPISMYKRISYITFISSKDNVRICICITSSFIFFFIIYYYHLPFVSLFFFFFNISHYAFTLYFILYINIFLRQTRQRFSVMQTVPKTDRETLNKIVYTRVTYTYM